MSGSLPNSNYNFNAGQPPVASSTSDSRLLDAAETLVTLQSRGAGGSSEASQSKNTNFESKRAVYLPYKMSPQPPTSSNAMGPPPPPPPNNVTFVLINQNSMGGQGDIMRPPVEPPPRRGRGRGRGRGGSEGRGRGRGRGRGARVQVPVAIPEHTDLDSSQEDVEMMDNNAEENREKVVKDETFMVGEHELKDSVFNDILNKKKLELMMDPEVVALFSKHQRSMKTKK